MRRTDIVQLYLVGFGLMFFVLVVSAAALAQTQDAINATMFERLQGILFRLDRIEAYMNAGIIALVLNFIAHLVQIRGQSSRRRSD